MRVRIGLRFSVRVRVGLELRIGLRFSMRVMARVGLEGAVAPEVRVGRT